MQAIHDKQAAGDAAAVQQEVDKVVQQLRLHVSFSSCLASCSAPSGALHVSCTCWCRVLWCPCVYIGCAWRRGLIRTPRPLDMQLLLTTQHSGPADVLEVMQSHWTRCSDHSPDHYCADHSLPDHSPDHRLIILAL